MRFSGFGPHATSFFAGLERTNTKAYFERNRGLWEAEIQEPLIALLTELAGRLGGEIKLFRQHRDVRFTRDKRPYKITTYGVIHGRGDSAAGLYTEMSARGLYCGAGYHDLAKDQLARFRRAVDDPSGVELETIVRRLEQAGLTVAGEALRSSPRGYAKDHPRVALLRKKALVAGATLPAGDDRLLSSAARRFVAGTWRKTEALCDWLDRYVGASDIPPEVRYGGGRARRT